MSYPNAASGVSKIRTGAILTLIATFCSIIAYIFAGAGVGAALNSKSLEGAVGSAIGGLVGVIIFAIADGVITLIAFILTLIGTIKGMKDEKAFSTAMIFVIIGNVCTIISLILTTKKAGNVFKLIGSIASIAAIVFIIFGVRNLAQRIRNSEVAEKSKSLVIISAIVCVLVLVSNIIILASGGLTAGAVGVAFSIIASVLNIVLLFIYIGYLGKGKVMLETA